MNAAKPLKVLVADDDPLFAEIVTILLAAEERIDVVGDAADGKEAVELAASLLPDVVLMDLSMPVMDGIEATRTISSSLPSVRVVVLTGSASLADVDSARAAGAVAYVTKDRIDRVADSILSVESTVARMSDRGTPTVCRQ